MFTTFLLCGLLLASPGLADAAPTYRELRCRVVNEHGKPVPDVQVYLCGLDRGAPSPDEVLDSSEFHPGWVFQANDRGCFTVRFGKFNPYQHDCTGADAGPGYGSFHLLAVKRGWAGGVSRLLLNLDEAALVAYWANRQSDPRSEACDHREWERGEFAPLPLADLSPDHPLDVVLKRGLTLRGQAVDTRGHPLPKQGVGIGLDLHYHSHTGAGGEIFGQSTVTDRFGHFLIRHVYPNLFRLDALGDDEPPLWVKTRVRGRWFDRVQDEITPRTGGAKDPADYERSIELRLVGARRPPYRYFGRVTNAVDQPVANLEVTVQTSRHEPAVSYEDNHGGLKTHTDQHGHYALSVYSPFANWVKAHDRTSEGGVEAPGEKRLPPGRYDFTLHPIKPQE